MPDRVIRDELLRSHRYRTLSSDTTRLLFLHLLLTVDNLGNCEATSTAIGDVLHRHVDDATVAKLLSELADVDLIRTYQVADKPYLHIPRFRQRLKYLGSKHPRPPKELECHEIRQLVEEYGLKAAYLPPLGARSEVKRSDVEVKNLKPLVAAKAAPRSVGTRLPDEWKIPEEWIEWSMTVYHVERSEVIRRSLEFRDYWIAIPGAKGVKTNWFATWRNNCRRKLENV